jgi:2-polyprenyl-3-methyl-5-hydroxy-6-metoxy-1,4-benzoquinol methylase
VKCRFCRTTLIHEFADLGNAPPSNSFLTEAQLNEPETFYPLKLYVCENCFLVQISEYKKSVEIFSNEYIYFSSFSTSWIEHARRYVEMAVNRFELTTKSRVIEIAANDGYLLQFFKKKAIPCLGIEPAQKTADEARKKGITVISEFFGISLARRLAKNKKADLLLGNNVLAHVPDINDFVEGLKILLAEKGRITMEFPHLLRLIEKNQFDTIYHEHFSYFSFYTVKRIFKSHGLTIFDVEELTTHGGSLRIFAKHSNDESQPVSNSVNLLLRTEHDHGMNQLVYYENFQHKINKVKKSLLSFLLDQIQKGKKIAAYGAAAKGNTLLNYCGVKKDLLGFVVDASPHKQNKYLPGSHIPVVSEETIKKEKPDFILILPWNIQSEITQQLQYINEWGGKFVVPIPQLKIMTP